MSSHGGMINPNTEGQKTESEGNAYVRVGTELDSKFVEFVHDLKKAARPVRLGLICLGSERQYPSFSGKAYRD